MKTNAKTLRELYPHRDTFTPLPAQWELRGITMPEHLTTHILHGSPGFGASGVVYLAVALAQEVARLQRENDALNERLSGIAALALNEE